MKLPSKEINMLSYFKNESNIEEYLNNSNNITEKKYKLIFISMLYEANDIRINYYCPNIVAMMEPIEQELLIKKESIHSLNYLIDYSQTKRVSYQIYTMEDVNNPEKIKVAQKVYKDFSNYGWLGKSFKYWNSGILPALLLIQNNILTNQDILNIEKYTQEISNLKLRENFKYHSHTQIIFNNDFLESINNIILVMEDINHIQILEKFIAILAEENFDFRPFTQKELLKNIEGFIYSFTIFDKLNVIIPLKEKESKKKKI